MWICVSKCHMCVVPTEAKDRASVSLELGVRMCEPPNVVFRNKWGSSGRTVCALNC